LKFSLFLYYGGKIKEDVISEGGMCKAEWRRKMIRSVD